MSSESYMMLHSQYILCHILTQCRLMTKVIYNWVDSDVIRETYPFHSAWLVTTSHYVLDSTNKHLAY